jgi:hypothetical protein
MNYAGNPTDVHTYVDKIRTFALKQGGSKQFEAYPLDTEDWGDFMLSMYELIGSASNLPMLSSRSEMLREVLQDLHDMIPQVRRFAT